MLSFKTIYPPTGEPTGQPSDVEFKYYYIGEPSGVPSQLPSGQPMIIDLNMLSAITNKYCIDSVVVVITIIVIVITTALFSV